MIECILVYSIFVDEKNVETKQKKNFINRRNIEQLQFEMKQFLKPL